MRTAEADTSRLVLGYFVGACGSVAVTTGVAAMFAPMPATPALALACALVGALVPVVPAVMRWRGASHAVVTSASLGFAAFAGGALAAYCRTAAVAAAPVVAAGLELAVMPHWLSATGRADHPVAASPVGSRWRVLWLAMGALALVQLIRLSAFVMAPALPLGSALPTYGAQHTCLPAYLHAVELARDEHELLYAPEAYRQPQIAAAEAGAISAPAATQIAGMVEYAGDHYQYPPPFLLLPGATLAVTQDFFRLRALWLMLTILCTLAGMAWVARRVDRFEAWPLSALALGSLPLLYTLQYGQVHLLVIVAAVVGAAMLTGDDSSPSRHAVGGALLAAAALTKLFPGLLVVVLLVRRQWRAVMWTAGMGALLVAASALVHGVEPYRVFFTDQLAHLVDGRAFAVFTESDEFLRSNFAIGSLVGKLDALVALPAADTLATAASGVYLVAVLVATVACARRRHGRDGRDGRDGEAVDIARLLALLCLASLVGNAFAPGIYTAAPILWLGALLCAARPPTRGWHWLVVAAAWGFFQLSPLAYSLPVMRDLRALHIPLAVVAQLAAVALAIAGLACARWFARAPLVNQAAGSEQT